MKTGCGIIVLVVLSGSFVAAEAGTAREGFFRMRVEPRRDAMVLPRWMGRNAAVRKDAIPHGPGAPDIFFGDGGSGFFEKDFGSREGGWAMAVQKDGKILLAGEAEVGGRTVFALIRLNEDGSPDEGFGAGGIGRAAFRVENPWEAETPIGTFTEDDLPDEQRQAVQNLRGMTGIDAWARAIVIQKDGKILTAGGMRLSYEKGAFEFFEDRELHGLAVARFMPDGSLDRTFGRNGRILTPLDDYKIVAVIEFSGLNPVIVNVKYEPIDPDYDGKKMNRLFQANSVALQADGKIVAGGTAYVEGRNIEEPYKGTDQLDCAVARYCPGGFLDNDDCGGDSFGFGRSGGVVEKCHETRALVPGEFDGEQWHTAIVVQGNGRIVTASHQTSVEDGLTLSAWCSNGSLADGRERYCRPAFGDQGDGTARASFGGRAYGARAILKQADGKLVVLGTAMTGNGKGFALARFDADGRFDSSFGGPGIERPGEVVTAFPGESAVYGAALAGQKDGKIIAVGFSPSGKTIIARYTRDGRLHDGRYSGGFGGRKGWVTFPDGKGYAAAADGACRILVSGAKDGNFFAARFLSGMEESCGEGWMMNDRRWR